MNFLCTILGHAWYAHLVAGSYGEPAEDKCSRCEATIQVQGYCRCLHPCDCPLVLVNGHRIHMNTPRRFVYQEEER